jgi:hypothetical protein
LPGRGLPPATSTIIAHTTTTFITTTSTRQNTFKFAKQRFLATSDFYLLQEQQPPGDKEGQRITPHLVGMIDKCPSKKANDNNYIVRWLHVHRSKAQINNFGT